MPIFRAALDTQHETVIPSPSRATARPKAWGLGEHGEPPASTLPRWSTSDHGAGESTVARAAMPGYPPRPDAHQKQRGCR